MLEKVLGPDPQIRILMAFPSGREVVLGLEDLGFKGFRIKGFRVKRS